MLEVRLRHQFAGFTLNVAFAAPSPGVTVLFGPSGAGKSTIVAALAGLLRPDEGYIAIDGTPLLDTGARLNLPPEHRRLGLVFQEARLFPHLSVAANLRYGLRRAPPGPIREADILDLLGIAHLLPRRPHTLSGGERQRVAIGRALLSQPRLLLMDEPLASLDAARKSEILPYLLALKTALALPIVYVTHAPDEVFAIADTLVLLEAGQVQAAGPLTDLTARGDLPLAARDDAGAVLSATIAEHHPARRLSLLAAGQMRLWVPLIAAPIGTALRLRIPAREIILATTAPDGISLHNIVPGHVRAVTEDPSRHAALVELNTGGAVLLARITPDAVARLGLTPGAPVLALIKSMAVDVLPR
jgi:molybdate transport system ATP-binding protein